MIRAAWISSLERAGCLAIRWAGRFSTRVRAYHLDTDGPGRLGGRQTYGVDSRDSSAESENTTYNKERKVHGSGYEEQVEVKKKGGGEERQRRTCGCCICSRYTGNPKFAEICLFVSCRGETSVNCHIRSKSTRFGINLEN